VLMQIKKIHPRTTTHQDNYYTRNGLPQWLTIARTSGTPATITPVTTGTQHESETHPNQRYTTTPGNKPARRAHQPTLQHHQDNPHWGDRPPEPNPRTFIVASRNANTISTNHNLLQWRATAQAFSKIHANIACIQEPNVNWSPTLTNQIQHIFQQKFGKAKMSTSSSLQTMLSKYQPGGTMTISLGSSTS